MRKLPSNTKPLVRFVIARCDCLEGEGAHYIMIDDMRKGQFYECPDCFRTLVTTDGLGRAFYIGKQI